VFKALWVDELDLNNPELMANVLADGGFMPAQVDALVNETEVKRLLTGC